MRGVGEGVMVLVEMCVAVALGVEVGVGLASVEHPTEVIVMSMRIENAFNRTRLGYSKRSRNAGDNPRGS